MISMKRKENGHRVSIVVCTKDRIDKLQECITSIKNQTKKPHELIIIDSSEKSCNKLLKTKKLDLRYFFQNLTMTQARNLGIDKSRGDIVLFLDDDAILEKDYIENLLKFYETMWNDKKFAGAEGFITNDNNKRFMERVLLFPKIPERNESYVVGILHGCNMSFKKSVLLQHRFDENTFGYYADDDDICSRISKKYRLYFVPEARLVHNHTPTGGARINDFSNFNTLVYNKFYIYRKTKTIKKTASLCLFYTVTFLRIFVFYKGRKSEAVKGVFYGFFRIFRSALKRDFKEEVRKI